MSRRLPGLVFVCVCVYANTIEQLDVFTWIFALRVPINNPDLFFLMIHFYYLSDKPIYVHLRPSPGWKNGCGGCGFGNFWLSFPYAAMPSAPDMKFQEARCLSEQYLPFSKETEWVIITVRQ